jgi:hypothetical protein
MYRSGRFWERVETETDMLQAELNETLWTTVGVGGFLQQNFVVSSEIL